MFGRAQGRTKNSMNGADRRGLTWTVCRCHCFLYLNARRWAGRHNGCALGEGYGDGVGGPASCKHSQMHMNSNYVYDLQCLQIFAYFCLPLVAILSASFRSPHVVLWQDGRHISQGTLLLKCPNAPRDANGSWNFGNENG